jgi:hypothetical protein
MLNDSPSVVGFQLLEITDFNELTFHLLEAISCHLVTTSNAPGSTAGFTGSNNLTASNAPVKQEGEHSLLLPRTSDLPSQFCLPSNTYVQKLIACTQEM